MKYFVQLSLIANLLFIYGDFSIAKEAYSEVDSNPPYKAVTELSFQEANKKIFYGEDENQFGLLWQASETQYTETLVVLIHGGCWLSAFDIQHTFAMATAINQAGFNVWSLEYRRTGETGGGWPTTYEDIKQGIMAIEKLSDKDISPSNLLIVGHSAGGHLALLAGRDIDSLLDNSINSHVIGLAAITDIASYAAGDNGCQKAGLQFMAGTVSEKPEEYHAANPTNHIINTSITLMHGEADPIVPLAQMSDFENTALEKHTVTGAGHFDWVHPGTEAFNRFLDNLRTLSQTH